MGLQPQAARTAAAAANASRSSPIGCELRAALVGNRVCCDGSSLLKLLRPPSPSAMPSLVYQAEVLAAHDVEHMRALDWVHRHEYYACLCSRMTRPCQFRCSWARELMGADELLEGQNLKRFLFFISTVGLVFCLVLVAAGSPTCRTCPFPSPTAILSPPASGR